MPPIEAAAEAEAVSRTKQKKLAKIERIAGHKAARKQQLEIARASMPVAEQVTNNEECGLSGEVRQEGGVSVTFMGPDIKGGDKWLGGELGIDGNIYGLLSLSLSLSLSISLSLSLSLSVQKKIYI